MIGPFDRSDEVSGENRTWIGVIGIHIAHTIAVANAIVIDSMGAILAT